MHPLPFGLVFLIPATTVLGGLLGGVWTFSTPIFVFLLAPVVDAVISVNTVNPDSDEIRHRWLFDGWLMLWVPAQLGLIAYGLVVVSGGTRTPFEQVGLTLAIGLCSGGIGITIAHELMHRKERWARGLAEVLMTSATYTHFCVEHVLGHHRHVATPLDPASSRRGESLYAFLPRTLWGSLASAWRLEGERVAKLGIPTWSLANRRVRYPLVLAVVYLAIAAGFGLVGVAFFLAQSLIAAVLLEIINYIEHYGLARREIAPGRYERVRPAHSWNSPHRFTAWLLFNLPRHADHHYLASRPYPLLRHFDDSPQLPTGYAGMILVALVPPIWRRVMDPRVDAWNAGRPETLATPRGQGLRVA